MSNRDEPTNPSMTGSQGCGPHCGEADRLVMVLHRLRLSGLAETASLAARESLSFSEVEELLSGARSEGLVKLRGGGRPGWFLTQEGRRVGEKLLDHQLDCRRALDCRADAADASALPVTLNRRAAVRQAYEDFIPLSGDMLSLCGRWQVTQIDPVVLNDHSDEAYDAAVIADLERIHERVAPVWRMLTEAHSRFAQYENRFGHALQNVKSGHLDWLTKPTLDSYHTIWFELHEDLLATLGLDRVGEHTRELTEPAEPSETS